MERARLLKLVPYAAAIGVLAASVALVAFLAFEIRVLELWSWAVGFAETKWQRVFSPAGVFLIGTAVLLVMEVFFLRWERTTIFVVFFRRSASAMVDIASAIVFFLTSLKDGC